MARMDELDRSISRRAVAHPEYGDLADVEVRRRRLIAQLVGLRRSNELTQVAVAELMGVGQSVTRRSSRAGLTCACRPSSATPTPYRLGSCS